TAVGADPEDPGGSPTPPPAPQNLVATVNSNGSVTFSWSAVSGVDGYELRIVNSSTVYPSDDTEHTLVSASGGTWSFYVVAIKDDLVSAASNTVQVTFPPSGGSGGGPQTPAEILNINGKGNGTGGWWNCGIGFRSADPEGSKHIDISASQLASGYIRDPYIVPNSGKTGVKMRVYCDGARTSSNTKYPRPEFRELKSDGKTKASWSATSGTHIMEWEGYIRHQTAQKPEIVFGQIHDGDADTFQLRWENGKLVATVRGDEVATVATGLTTSSLIRAKVEVNGGQLRFYYDGALK